MIEDGIVGWHHPLHGHEFEQTLGDNEGQVSLECCNPWGRKELDMTERLNINTLAIAGSWSSPQSIGVLRVSQPRLSRP